MSGLILTKAEQILIQASLFQQVMNHQLPESACRADMPAHLRFRNCFLPAQDNHTLRINSAGSDTVQHS